MGILMDGTGMFGSSATQGGVLVTEMRQKRRKILINKKSQIRFSIITISAIVILSVLFLLAIMIPLYIYSLDARNNIQTTMRQIDLYLIQAKLLPVLLIYLVCVGIFTIYHTHKIFGPVFRFQRSIQQMTDNDFSFRIQLRRHDYMHGMQRIFNEFLANFSLKIDDLQKSTADLNSEIKTITSQWAGGEISPANLGTALEKLENMAAVVESKSKEFKIS